MITRKLGLLRCVSLASFAALALTIVGFAPAALAGTTYPYTGQSFGPGGIGSGEFGNAESVALDQGSGDVFVYDAGEGGRVYKFDAAGEPVSFSALGTNVIEGVGGTGESEAEIAVDSSSGPDAGDIYVANNFEVRIYGADGSPLGELTGGEYCGVAVDPAGEVYVGDYPETVKKYTPATNPVTNSDETASMGGLDEVCNVAVDGSGDVYAATYSGGVNRFEASQFGSSAASGTQIDEHGRTLAVDPSSGHVFLDEESSIAEYDSAGSPLGTSGAGNLSRSFGVAATGDKLYAAAGGVVEIFGPATQVGASIDSTTAATALSGPAVTLQAQVNTQGLATTYRFEYGPTTSYGTNVPVPDGEIGASFGDQPVSQEVQGLAQDTIYHYRVVVTDSLGTVDGPDETFFTGSAAFAAPTSFSDAAVLPDGRVYEQVSPANKHGWEAGAQLDAGHGQFQVGVASADGDSIAYEGPGPGADVNSSGVNFVFVGQRSAAGWSSRAAMPRGLNLEETLALEQESPFGLDFSADLSHLAYYIKDRNVPEATDDTSNLYLEGPDPFATPVWLARPAITVNEGERFLYMILLGGAPDLSTVYFTYNGFLLPEDVEVAKNPEVRGPGLYEYRDGAVREAAILPNGKISPFGAEPLSGASSTGAAIHTPALPDVADNQISEDGKTIFFVSPASGSSPQLYVRTTAADGSRHTVLVSASALPGHVGEQAPDGVSQFANTAPESIDVFGNGGKEATIPTYGYASPDGSHVVFVSKDRLTSDAPSDASAKTYDFDVDTGALEYLPGIAPGSGIVTSAQDGSWFVFENASSSPVELDRWSQGPGGGAIAPIVQLPGNACDGLACVGPARVVDGGSVLVFTSDAPIAGFNDAGGFKQVFRYDFASGKLGCASCPPAGVKPSGDAFFSGSDEYLNSQNGGGTADTNDSRGVSADGSRIFFDSPDPLVGRDTNGKRDVYEWEDGVVYLISSGSSPNDSLLLDNSESGGDVFFATTSELAKGDDDLAYDVYDARVPRPGDSPPSSSVPCQGDVCQGAPSVPSLLGAPASATFNGLGNVAPQAAEAKPTVVVKKKAAPKKKKQKKKHKKKQATKSKHAKKSNHGKGSR